MNGARVFQSPTKYFQHPGLIKDVGKLVTKTYPTLKRPSVLISKRSLSSEQGKQLVASFHDPVVYVYESECSRDAVNQVAKAFEKEGVDHVISFGGGKIVDVGKLVADMLDTKSIVVPSVASTDAPCTALSVLYTPEGLFDEYVFFAKSPDMVLVDSEVIFTSPIKFLVAGMGDAMSTYYEARAVMRNPAAASLVSPFTYRPPVMVLAISKQCRDVLYDHGLAAISSMKSKIRDESFENVVEAAILMSGLGAESGGLAAAHAIHNALNELPEAHSMMHGEKVAFGTICQLMLEGDEEEAMRVVNFNKMVGLPTTFKDMGIDITKEKLDLVAKHCMNKSSTMWNVGPHITHELIVQAMVKADQALVRVDNLAAVTV